MSDVTTGSEWEVVVGLEVHVELRTATKLFCSCPNSFGDVPNTNVCPVCLGLPGSLPVLNSRAVEMAATVGLALNARVQPSRFHRKNYFYPDMPKDYQISQYDLPICAAGWLDLPDGHRVGVERAHLEEDTGKSTHLGGGGRLHGSDGSLVDYNRAGVPLVEVVSAPDIRSAEQARSYVAELRSILVATGVSDGRMEEGSLRVDANVSVRRRGGTLGTRCEIKNLNSLRSLGRAIEHDAARQVAVVESGRQVSQETRHWNEEGGHTVPLRSKEEAFDYRYFPEPDLVPVEPPGELLDRLASEMPPLPAERRRRLIDLASEGRQPSRAAEDQVATVVDLGLDDLVLGAASRGASTRLALARAANEAATDPSAARGLSVESFAKLVSMEDSGRLSATQAKAVLARMLGEGGSPEQIAASLGYEALDPSQLSAAVETVLATNGAEWQRFVDGDEKVAGFFVGQVMRVTGGKADGRAVRQVLAQRRLDSLAP
ncbi:MAG: Asp-tRNA(Asn)/Glu-tRNA(Gln) amidotransferase subunit GatB [Actinomycetota bacterium]|nr:Asp-tRNA(Asn)/Glu-tRNA(Gln) amidotransferase subunit GatB [Actinomycetota bacterium]